MAIGADGHLCSDGLDLAELAARVGTPLHVVDASRLDRNATEALAPHRGGHGADMFFSYKTNPVPAVLTLAWPEIPLEHWRQFPTSSMRSWARSAQLPDDDHTVLDRLPDYEIDASRAHPRPSVRDQYRLVRPPSDLPAR